MKKIVLKYSSFVLILLLIGLAFCKKDLIYKSAPATNQNSINNLAVDPGFNYVTSVNTDFTIKAVDIKGKNMINIRVDILSDYVANGGRLITSGTTDTNGVFKTIHPLPAFYKNIVISTKYPGIEGEYPAQINSGIVTLTINQNKPFSKTPSQTKDITADNDNDGVADIYDDYPSDPDKSFNSFFPVQGKTGTLAFEDLWPSKGDYDFNDLVVDYNVNQVLNAQQQVVEIDAKYIVKAMGASFENGFGFQLNVDPLNIISVTGTKLTDNYINVSANGVEANQKKAVIIVFDNAAKHFKNIHGQNPTGAAGYNTSIGGIYGTPDTLYVVVRFAKPIAQNVLGNPPYNSFIITNKRRGYEVHLSDQSPTDLANISLLGKYDDNSDVSLRRYYKSKNNLPWAINISQSFSYPTEKAYILNAYLKFAAWAESNGTSFNDWFSNTSSTYRDNNYIFQ